MNIDDTPQSFSDVLRVRRTRSNTEINPNTVLDDEGPTRQSSASEAAVPPHFDAQPRTQIQPTGPPVGAPGLNVSPRRPPGTDTPQTSETAAPQPSETATEVANNSQDPDPGYVFDKLLEHDFSESVPRYLVKWNGYPTAEATWDPQGHIPFNAVSRYHHKNKLPPPEWYPDPTH